MGSIITIANHKGGVGKTTLILNLASYLTTYYKKILVLDFDPQANTTWGLFNLADHQKVRIQDVLKYGVRNEIDTPEDYDKFNEVIWSARVDMTKNDGQISLIGSSLDLAATKIELSKFESTVYFKIVEIIRYLSKGYDITLIDTPPSLEMLTASSIYASDYLLLPIQLDLMAIKGATDILKNILPTAHKYYNPGIRVLGVIINMHKDTRSQRVSNEVAKKTFGDYLFKTILSQSEKIKSLSVTRGTVDAHSPKSKSGDQFKALAKEVYDRIERGKDVKEK
jgi:chromosome partitioning protein